MNQLRQRYLDHLKATQRGETRQKQLVAKGIGPQVVCLRNEAGEVIGFAPVERLSPDELQKQLVAKSVDDSNGLGCGLGNDIFDDLFEIRPTLQTNAVEISKSADDPNAELAGIFPLFLQPR